MLHIFERRILGRVLWPPQNNKIDQTGESGMTLYNIFDDRTANTKIV